MMQSPTFVSGKIGVIPLMQDKRFQGRVSTSKVFEMTLSRNVVRKDSAIFLANFSNNGKEDSRVLRGRRRLSFLDDGAAAFLPKKDGEPGGGGGGGGPHLDQIPPPPPLTTCRFGRCRARDGKSCCFSTSLRNVTGALFLRCRMPTSSCIDSEIPTDS